MRRELQPVALKGVNLRYRTRDPAKLCVCEQKSSGDIAAALRAETRGGWLECIGRFSRQTRGKESLLFHRESGKTVSLYAIMARICRTSRITVPPRLHWIGTCALRYTHESAKRSAMRYILDYYTIMRFLRDKIQASHLTALFNQLSAKFN